MNRQINERLKTLISAYKALGGSFTGQLTPGYSSNASPRVAPGGFGARECLFLGL
jgi:hypothetical protein